MKYYKYKDKFGVEYGLTYVEVEGTENQVLRQAGRTQNSYILSSRKNPVYFYYLCDQEIDWSAKEYKPISKEEFLNIWEDGMKEYQVSWEEAKSGFSIGTKMTGKVEVFYPQGIILNLGHAVPGILPYERYHCKKPITSLYPGDVIKAEVCGYEEDNMWLMLESSSISALT